MTVLERGRTEHEPQHAELVCGLPRTTGAMRRAVIHIAENPFQDPAARISAHDLHERLATEGRAAIGINRQRPGRDVAVDVHLQHLTPRSEGKTAGPSGHHTLKASAHRRRAEAEL